MLQRVAIEFFVYGLATSLLEEVGDRSQLAHVHGRGLRELHDSENVPFRSTRSSEQSSGHLRHESRKSKVLRYIHVPGLRTLMFHLG